MAVGGGVPDVTSSLRSSFIKQILNLPTSGYVFNEKEILFVTSQRTLTSLDCFSGHAHGMVYNMRDRGCIGITL